MLCSCLAHLERCFEITGVLDRGAAPMMWRCTCTFSFCHKWCVRRQSTGADRAISCLMSSSLKDHCNASPHEASAPASSEAEADADDGTDALQSLQSKRFASAPMSSEAEAGKIAEADVSESLQGVARILVNSSRFATRVSNAGMSSGSTWRGQLRSGLSGLDMVIRL